MVASLISVILEILNSLNEGLYCGSVFSLNAKKVRICEIMSGGFAVKIQQCVKQVRRFLVTFSFC